jgi:hypothetical protein
MSADATTEYQLTSVRLPGVAVADDAAGYLKSVGRRETQDRALTGIQELTELLNIAQIPNCEKSTFRLGPKEASV